MGIVTLVMVSLHFILTSPSFCRFPAPPRDEFERVREIATVKAATTKIHTASKRED